MGKGGRICCITLPWALTVASLICLILIEISGWTPSTLQDLYLMKVDFKDISVGTAADGALSTSSTLQDALKLVESELDQVYNLHLWNYCSSGKHSSHIDHCSARQAEYTFDPFLVWGLDASPATSKLSGDQLKELESSFSGEIQYEEDKLIGKSGREVLSLYRKASKAVFILYAVAFFTTIATLLLSILAVFSRWGSFLTWIFSGISSVLLLAAVGLTTGIYIALTVALRDALHKYNIHVDFGTGVFVVGWLSVAFSWAATLFWLFSVCCCAGSSNPHHRSNKGGLWRAEPKGMGYGNYGRRSLQEEKEFGQYDRAGSPFGVHEHSDTTPLNPRAVPPPPTTTQYQTAAYEPYRHA